MSKRWTPGFGDAYYYVDNACSVDIERYDGHTWDDERIAVGNCFNTKDDAHAAAEKVKELLLSLQDSTNKLQDDIQDMVTNTCQAMDKGKENVAKATCNFGNLPKLTAEVFDRPDCPEWAKYAAVHDGNLIFTDQEPGINEHGLFVSASDAARIEKTLIVPFKSSEHYFPQVIERPEKENKLPDWCKVDATGWHKRCGYFKVTYIDDVSKRVDIQQVEDKSKGYLSFHTVCNEVIQANLRPYNDEEMKALVGKILVNKETRDINLVTDYIHEVDEDDPDFHYCTVYVGGENMTAGDLLEDFTIDDKPCGIIVE